jgi:hypothetical protein
LPVETRAGGGFITSLYVPYLDPDVFMPARTDQPS